MKTKAGTKAVVYIFLTKMILMILIELPYEKLVLGEADFLALYINLVFPPIYMYLVGASIQVPGIRNTQEIVGRKEKIGVITSIRDFLIFPFAKIGYWISETYSQINIFLLLLDFFIETPLKKILGVFEDWQDFIKEKRDEYF